METQLPNATDTIHINKDLHLQQVAEVCNIKMCIRDRANASSWLGVNIKEVECSIYECIINEADIREAIYTTDIDGLDIVSSHLSLIHI